VTEKIPSALLAKAVADDPENSAGALKRFGGSMSDHFNSGLLNQVALTLDAEGSGEGKIRQAHAMMAALAGVAPKDELEAMLGGQLIAVHNAAMESFRRAAHENQTPVGREEALRQAGKLSRTFAQLLDALNRHRGKGQQKVTVEHVHIHAGGQAVVGLVESTAGGGRRKNGKQPHEKRIANSPTPALRSEDTGRSALPVGCDGEREMPVARRAVDGSAKGK
jgi:hypothetical protein